MGAPPWQSRGTDLEVTDVEALAELPLPADEDELASVAMVFKGCAGCGETHTVSGENSQQRLKKRSADVRARQTRRHHTGERRTMERLELQPTS